MSVNNWSIMKKLNMLIILALASALCGFIIYVNGWTYFDLFERTIVGLALVLFVVFLGLLIYWLRNNARFIKKLNEEIHALEGGDLNREIPVYNGNSELAMLAESIDDFRIAPFHILACEGKVFSEEAHVWHMETIRKYITGSDPVFMATPFICIDTEDPEKVQKGVDWWLTLTSEGGEGMVVKPEFYTARYNGKLLQPAVKCRGKEYLRIIYGPEYLFPDHLDRLKKRSLSHKRTLALKEFSLGIESLKRFVNREPLYKIHECSFAVLALESEPVDPRL